MTEQEWLAGTDPATMLHQTRSPLPVSDRKLRLYCCALARRYYDYMNFEQSKSYLETAEQCAEGYLEDYARFQSLEACERLFGKGWASHPIFLYPDCLVGFALWTSPRYGAQLASSEYATSEYATRTGALAILRDVIGNPFRSPTLTPYLRISSRRRPNMSYEYRAPWLTNEAISIAQGAYDDMDWGKLPILADCLEESGFLHQEMLDHLRGPGPHARGCWAVDLLLGKE